MTHFDELVRVVSEGSARNGVRYRDAVVLVGAHADRPKSLLTSDQPLALEGQLKDVRRLHALDVVARDKLEQWAKSGVKGSDVKCPLIQSSDAHGAASYEHRYTWMYLPEVTAASLLHAFATPEASIVWGDSRPPEPTFWIRAIEFEGGFFDGKRFEFSPRVTAIIGAPSSGKSFILDSLRFAFGGESQVDDVKSLTQSRFDRCLPVGAAVTVELLQDGQERVVRRVRGGYASAAGPNQPLFFGQTELTRRAMESTPAMHLLDMHTPATDGHVADLKRLSSEIMSRLGDAVSLAEQSRQMRSEVTNPLDGLNATRKEYDAVVGSQPVALRAQQLTTVERWRATVRGNLKTWRELLKPLTGPQIPNMPAGHESFRDDLKPLLVDVGLKKLLDAFNAKVAAAADELVKALQRPLDRTDSEFADLRTQVETELGQKITQGSAVLARMNDLRERLDRLQATSDELTRLDADIDERLVKIFALVDGVSDRRLAMREDRKATCTRLNASMPDFVARIASDAETDRLDALLDELKAGTYFRDDTIAEIRAGLDRQRIIERIVRVTQQVPMSETRATNAETLKKQDELVEEALEREKTQGLAALAGYWPGDRLELLQKVKGSPPVPFEKLTEGLRALAIKEVSFAASDVPVVTDQPEDAVPTARVFDSLVPTLRTQRARRQFIVASHDANIVVAGDAERVYVLSADPNIPPTIGTLFDRDIRGHALMHLEGGPRAFEIRQRRYAQEAEGSAT